MCNTGVVRSAITSMSLRQIHLPLRFVLMTRVHQCKRADPALTCYRMRGNTLKRPANITNYLKAIAGILAPLGVGLETAFPGNRWSPLVITLISSSLVYLVPNVKGTAPVTGTTTATTTAEPPVPVD